jgi:hypothetical protein
LKERGRKAKEKEIKNKIENTQRKELMTES